MLHNHIYIHFIDNDIKKALEVNEKAVLKKKVGFRNKKNISKLHSTVRDLINQITILTLKIVLHCRLQQKPLVQQLNRHLTACDVLFLLLWSQRGGEKELVVFCNSSLR